MLQQICLSLTPSIHLVHLKSCIEGSNRDTKDVYPLCFASLRTVIDREFQPPHEIRPQRLEKGCEIPIIPCFSGSHAGGQDFFDAADLARKYLPHEEILVLASDAEIAELELYRWLARSRGRAGRHAGRFWDRKGTSSG